MTQETKHTPTPWRYSERGNWIFAPLELKEPIICEIARIQEYKANASFIVRACNSHDALVEALKEIIKQGYETSAYGHDEAIRVAREALKLAGAE